MRCEPDKMCQQCKDDLLEEKSINEEDADEVTEEVLGETGRPFHQVQNCLLLKAEDSREGWADLMQKATMALMTGAGIGVDYSAIRAEGKPIRKTGGFATGPLALMQMLNEAGRGIMQGVSQCPPRAGAVSCVQEDQSGQR